MGSTIQTINTTFSLGESTTAKGRWLPNYTALCVSYVRVKAKDCFSWWNFIVVSQLWFFKHEFSARDIRAKARMGASSFSRLRFSRAVVRKWTILNGQLLSLGRSWRDLGHDATRLIAFPHQPYMVQFWSLAHLAPMGLYKCVAHITRGRGRKLIDIKNVSLCLTTLISSWCDCHVSNGFK